MSRLPPCRGEDLIRKERIRLERLDGSAWGQSDTTCDTLLAVADVTQNRGATPGGLQPSVAL